MLRHVYIGQVSRKPILKGFHIAYIQATENKWGGLRGPLYGPHVLPLMTSRRPTKDPRISTQIFNIILDFKSKISRFLFGNGNLKESRIDYVLELQQCEMPDIFEMDGEE